MKKWCVKVGFTGCENKEKALYHKNYIVKAETADAAGVIAYNGLSMAEFHNFVIQEVTEIEH